MPLINFSRWLSPLIGALALVTLSVSADAAEKTKLPERVETMRNMILTAARSGKVEELREALEWNELPPAVSQTDIKDPVAFWKRQSADGAGAEIMATLIALLSGPPAIRKQPSDGPLYVWPKLVDVPYAKLTPKERVSAIAGLTSQQIKQVATGKPYTGYILTIGHDGTWHTFMKE